MNPAAETFTLELDPDIFYCEIDGEMVEFQRIIIDRGGEHETVLNVEPSEDSEPYDAALRAAGFEPVGDDAVTRG